jgi:hypothetical protein
MRTADNVKRREDRVIWWVLAIIVIGLPICGAFLVQATVGPYFGAVWLFALVTWIVRYRPSTRR